MGSLKPVIGLLRTVVPIIYCGSLLYYFIGYGGSIQDAESIGLGPVLLGLAAVGVIFCIVLAIKLVLIFVALRSPGAGGRRGPDAATNDGADNFDADATIARYMARRSAEAGPRSPTAPVASKAGGVTRGSSFGRRVR